MECVLQKSLKDKVPNLNCNLEYAWYFHVECPDYIKKYEELGSKYLKQQMYNMLSLPYFEFRKNLAENKPNSYDIMPTLQKSENFLRYPENKVNVKKTISSSLLFDNTLRKDFSEGVEFQADPQ